MIDSAGPGTEVEVPNLLFRNSIDLRPYFSQFSVEGIHIRISTFQVRPFFAELGVDLLCFDSPPSGRSERHTARSKLIAEGFYRIVGRAESRANVDLCSGRSGSFCASSEDRFCGAEILFCIDADGVAGRRGDVDVDAVVEQAELLKPLDLLDPGGRRGREFLQRRFAIGVDAEMLAIAGKSGVVAIEGDGGAGEVERAAVGGGDDFDGAGIVDVVRAGSGRRGSRPGLQGVRRGCSSGVKCSGVRRGSSPWMLT